LGTLVQRAVVAAKTLQREHAELLKSRDAHTLAEFWRQFARLMHPEFAPSSYKRSWDTDVSLLKNHLLPLEPL